MISLNEPDYHQLQYSRPGFSEFSIFNSKTGQIMGRQCLDIWVRFL